MQDICNLSVKEMRRAIAARDLSVREICRAYLSRIEQMDGSIQAYLTVDAERLIDEAGELDQRLQAGTAPASPLTGIPVAVKDNIATRGLRTTCASRILENFVPPYDATVVERLRRSGALVLGKTNCDEFAMGSTTEHSAFFPTRNPWDRSRVPGGSSGGSAAAVAARLAPVALGSDTGGSVRQPAAFCGVIGLKPTYGRVSRYGLVAFGSSLDQIGPLTRTVEDAAELLQVLAGHDPKDSTCSTEPVDTYQEALGREVRGIRIGVPKEWFGQGLDPHIERAVRNAIARLEKLGCEIQETTLPHTPYAIATYYIIAPAEASSNLARYDGVKYGHRSARGGDLETMYRYTRSEGFGEEVQRRIMIGTYVLSSGYYDAYYLKAGRVRRLLAQDYERAFQEVDLLVGPTTPTLPFVLGEKREDPLGLYLADIYTATGNLAGIPGIALPCAFTEGRLPVGLQLQAPHFHESRLLQVAYALEQDLALRPPALDLPA